MRAEKEVGPQGANPGGTDNSINQSQSNGNGRQVASPDEFVAEIEELPAKSKADARAMYKDLDDDADDQGDTPEADVRLFLDMLYGGGTGFCHVIYGKDPYLNDKGKLRFRFWSETQERYAYTYPADAGAAVAKILELSATNVDVYVSTSLMRTATSRTQTQTAELWCLHVDFDQIGLNLDAVAQLGWCAIASGTPGATITSTSRSVSRSPRRSSGCFRT